MANDDSSNWIYLLRNTQQHHVQLSAFADQKANIIIASNSIIFSLTLSKMELAQHFWGAWALLITAVLSIVSALIVVAPLSLPKKRPNDDSNHFNILFFSHFAALEHDDFQDKMKNIMSSKDEVQYAMVRDIYQIGKILNTRKILLRIDDSIIISSISHIKNNLAQFFARSPTLASWRFACRDTDHCSHHREPMIS
jgi:hypothetical protein